MRIGTVPAAIAIAWWAATAAVAAPGGDPARRACYADAKRLCPEAVRALARHRAELCLAAHIDQTTPGCHAMIVKVKAERDTAATRRPG